MTEYVELDSDVMPSEDNNHECVICFKKIHKHTSNIIKYSCDHIYHYDCVSAWTHTSGHVIDYCMSCDTVRHYTIISNIKRTKLVKLRKRSDKHIQRCCCVQ